VTIEGEIAGTPAYMSPEQAEGEPADARSDVFSFGVVLYQLLSGRKPFSGDSTASILAAVLREEPPAVGPKIPRDLEKMIKRCLRKNPARRYQHIDDLRVGLEDVKEELEGGIAEQELAPAAGKSPAKLLWILALALATIVVAMGAMLARQEKPAARLVRFAVAAPDGRSIAGHVAVSPDGESIAYPATDGHQTHLYLTSLATGLTRQLPGTEGGGSVAWAFDSRALLVYRGPGQPLLRMDLNGSPPQPLSLPFQPQGLPEWGPEGIVSAAIDRALYWVQPDGSGARQLRDPGTHDSVGTLAPTLIPGGRWLIYHTWKVNSGIATAYDVHLLSMDAKKERKLFSTDSGFAYYAAPGYILYLQDSSLMARPIDPATGEIRGESQTVVGGVSDSSTSGNGEMAYLLGNGAADSQLIWFDRSGANLGIASGPAVYTNPTLSPDGTRVALDIRDPVSKTRDLWICDLSRGSKSKLTFDPKDDLNPTWSPDGSRIAFSSDRRGHRDLYVKSASGVGDDELLLESNTDKNIEAWSPDGRTLIYNSDGHELWTWSFDTRKAQPFFQGKLPAYNGNFSPDGKWVAYTSFESGRSEIYIRPFTDSSGSSRGQWLISNAGGLQPQWRGDGKELFYTSLTRQIMAVDVGEKAGAIVHGTPHVLFEARIPRGQGRSLWLVSRDGQRFLLVVPVGNQPATRIEVVLNWPSLLTKR
jgi:Tol biopolymer transport system component